MKKKIFFSSVIAFFITVNVIIFSIISIYVASSYDGKYKISDFSDTQDNVDFFEVRTSGNHKTAFIQEGMLPIYEVKNMTLSLENVSYEVDSLIKEFNIGTLVDNGECIGINDNELVYSNHIMRLIRISYQHKIELTFQIIDNISYQMVITSSYFDVNNAIVTYYDGTNVEKPLTIDDVVIDSNHNYRLFLSGFVIDEKSINGLTYTIRIKYNIPAESKFLPKSFVFFDLEKQKYYLKHLIDSKEYGLIYKRIYLEKIEYYENYVFLFDDLNIKYLYTDYSM